LVAAGVLLISLLFGAREEDRPTLGAYANGKSMSYHVYRGVTSIQGEAPGAIASRVYAVIGPIRWNVPNSVRTSDETVAEMWLTVGSARWRAGGWTKAANRIRRALGRKETSEWTIVAKKTIAESKRLYLRITPGGEFYVSTAEDREHAIHEDPSPTMPMSL